MRKACALALLATLPLAEAAAHEIVVRGPTP
jgi:hypothetical protein